MIFPQKILKLKLKMHIGIEYRHRLFRRFLLSLHTLYINKLGFFGNLIGQGLGKLTENLVGKEFGGANIGVSLGGSLIPFKNGGTVPGRKGKPRVILAHSGEYILPCGVSPTVIQEIMGQKMKL